MNSSSTKNCNKKSNCLDHSHGIRGGKSVSLRIQTEVSDLLPQDNATPIKHKKEGKYMTISMRTRKAETTQRMTVVVFILRGSLGSQEAPPKPLLQ